MHIISLFYGGNVSAIQMGSGDGLKKEEDQF